MDGADCANAQEEKRVSRRPVRQAAARSKMSVERMLAPAAIFMAVVAGGGAVGITVDVGVSIVGLRLLVSSLCVAVDAGEAGVVGGNLVAIATNRAVVGNGEISVIESSAEPVCSGVAGVASGWISRRDVVRDRTTESLRAVPIGEMATVASRIGSSEAVIVVEVARGAGSVHVCAGQSPASSGVVEHAGIPGHRYYGKWNREKWESPQ